MLPLMHGLNADPDAPLSTYRGRIMQEKLRGVRFYWDGRSAWTRQAKPINLPLEWSVKMPAIPLDAELYFGVDGERKCANAVRFGGKHWHPGMKICVFDCPDAGAAGFCERLGFVSSVIDRLDLDWLKWIPAFLIEDENHIKQSLSDVLSRDGEGLMIRQDSAPYTIGRSNSLIKLKRL